MGVPIRAMRAALDIPGCAMHHFAAHPLTTLEGGEVWMLTPPGGDTAVLDFEL